MPVKTSTSDTAADALIKMLGPPGVPQIDSLGRINGQTIPDYLMNSANSKAKGVKEDKTEYTKITLIKDSTLEYKNLCLKVFVQPDPDVGALEDEARYAKMFAKTACRRAESVLEADLVIFSGGTDVDPQLYGEKPHKTTLFDTRRDEIDIRLYTLCVEEGIPMFGVCRGAQFLSVMNGGKLFQHIDGHQGNHSIIDSRTGSEIMKVSSCHHQMVMPNTLNGMEVLAFARKTTERWTNDKNCFVSDTQDIEAFFYRDTCCLGVQGHPEYEDYHYFQKWVLDLVYECVTNNPDLDWTTGSLRMKKELLDQRGTPFADLSEPLLLTQKA